MNTTFLLQYVSIAKDGIIILAAAVGAYVALRGLSTWNRQLKGGIEYDLTRRILKCTFRLREGIKGVRHPIMSGNEMSLQPENKAQGLTRDQLRYYGKVNAYHNRWKKVTDVRADLQTELLEAEALWGRIIYEKFEPLFALQQELFLYVHAYLAVCNPDDSDQSREAFQEIMQKLRNILYDTSSEVLDDFSRDVSRAIETIELFLQPRLRK